MKVKEGGAVDPKEKLDSGISLQKQHHPLHETVNQP